MSLGLNLPLDPRVGLGNHLWPDTVWPPFQLHHLRKSLHRVQEPAVTAPPLLISELRATNATPSALSSMHSLAAGPCLFFLEGTGLPWTLSLQSVAQELEPEWDLLPLSSHPGK